MNIELLSTTTSRPLHWIRQAANKINQAISFINQQGIRTVVSANYSLNAKDTYLGVQGGYTVTLADPEIIRKIIIKDESGNAAVSPITVAGVIDGATNYTINTNYGVLRLISNGTDWSIV